MMMTQKLTPTYFIGHGSPMNAIADNNYTKTLHELGENLKSIKAILVISAHWNTKGIFVTEAAQPKTIHDFYGFPDELFKVQYPAPGVPKLAQEIINKIPDLQIKGDKEQWGLDHGTWSVLRHMFPKADIPVLQLSMDLSLPAQTHFEIGQKLYFLREKGVLILGSGNVVHNLRKIKWEMDAPPFPWAEEFDHWMKDNLKQKNFSPLIHDFHKTEAGKLSIPTLEHYYPLFYILGAARENEKAHFVFEEIQNASISMMSVGFF